MKNSRKNLLFWLGVLVLLTILVAVSAFVVAYFNVEQQYAQVVENIEKPAPILFYENLLSARDEALDSTDDQPQRLNDSEVSESALRTMATFASLFEDSYAVWVQYRSVHGLDHDLLQTPYNQWSEEERGVAGLFLRGQREFLDAVRDAAILGDPVYALDILGRDDTEDHHLRDLWGLALLLRFDAVYNGAQDKYSEAVQDILAGIRLADALAMEPLLDSQHRRWSIYRTMIEGFEDAFAEGMLPHDLAAELLAHLAQGENRKSYAHAWASAQYKLIESREDWSETSLKKFVEETGWYWGLRNRLWASAVCQPWARKDASTVVRMLTDVRKMIERPYYEITPKIEQFDRDYGDLSVTHHSARKMAPRLLEQLPFQAIHEARLRLTRIGVVVELHGRRDGVYPKSLDAIREEFGGKLPVDPFTGQSFRYAPSGGTFTLYSVGQNLVDNGGMQSYSEGDIVWRGKKTESLKGAPEQG